jgi:hypothetical protein
VLLWVCGAGAGRSAGAGAQAQGRRGLTGSSDGLAPPEGVRYGSLLADCKDSVIDSASADALMVAGCMLACTTADMLALITAACTRTTNDAEHGSDWTRGLQIIGYCSARIALLPSHTAPCTHLGHPARYANTAPGPPLQQAVPVETHQLSANTVFLMSELRAAAVLHCPCRTVTPPVPQPVLICGRPVPPRRAQPAGGGLPQHRLGASSSVSGCPAPVSRPSGSAWAEAVEHAKRSVGWPA